MSKWGWKHGAMFLVGLACATSVLVAAGLADASGARAPATAAAASGR